MNLKINNKGITLITLTIMIVILLIIASITIYSGRESIQKAQLEGIRTNMLLIQAKARECVEEANFKMGINPDDEKKTTVRQDIYETNVGLQKASGNINVNIPGVDISELYYLTDEVYQKWGLENIERIEGEYYLLKFDETNVTVEVYNVPGYKDCYSLTQIDNIE